MGKINNNKKLLYEEFLARNLNEAGHYFASKILRKISLIQEARVGLRIHSKGIGAICLDQRGI